MKYRVISFFYGAVASIIAVGTLTRRYIRFFLIVGYGAIRMIHIVLRSVNQIIFSISSYLFSQLRILSKFLLAPIKRNEVWYFMVGFLVAFSLLFGFFVYYQYKSLPDPADIGVSNLPLSSHIYDRNGKLLYEVYRNESRTLVPISELPEHVVEATVAIEDKDFYHHVGISPISGVLRAIRDSILKKDLQGGSTITQQLVKLSLLTSDRTIERKLKEAVLALRTERLYSKTKILELYLNQVPYGGAIYGIEEAAQVYFGKSARQLSTPEAALLAGLPQSPTQYSPYRDRALSISRRNDVLAAMKEQGYISSKQYAESVASEPDIIPYHESIQAPHFVFYVKDKLEDELGLLQLETGGLTVKTTLDLDLQHEVERILREEILKIRNLNVGNGAVLVTKPKTGEILAMVGSVDYHASPSGAFNVTTAHRQPGSSIKPIMYSLALARGFTEASVIDDVPTVFAAEGAAPYRPVNYDGRFHGKVTLRYALANSYNVPAVRILNEIGVRSFITYANRLGIESWDLDGHYGLSLTLGGGEVTMVELATAMGALANGGYRVNLTPFAEVRDTTARTLGVTAPVREQVIDPGAAYIISDILSDNVARTPAFGSNSTLQIPGYRVAVKTGTTDLKKDNWTIGYTPEYLVAVWVGNNDNTPMHPTLTSGITGAAPIWNRVMKHILETYPQEQAWYETPEHVIEKRCQYGRVQYFLAGTENSVSCALDSTGKNPSPKVSSAAN